MLGVFGEIGTTNEDDAAVLINAGGVTMLAVADISGRYVRAGIRFGPPGVHVVDHLGDIGPAARRLLDAL